ncbi:hypothetical protein T10_9254 [Trichinella papuae]|uniref:Uncharacterized protein n=1 Tax=Trichinella papuae TaxID=268474 RepID=A0A0V1MSS0_9BILA|nr:hypothetical protein T10_9254 [Trichinella papuae]
MYKERVTLEVTQISAIQFSHMLAPVAGPVNQLFACYLTDAKRRSRVDRMNGRLFFKFKNAHQSLGGAALFDANYSFTYQI